MAAIDPPDGAGTHARLSTRANEYLESRARQGIWIVDEHFRTTFVSDSMAAMLGRAPAEMLGRPVLDFVPEDLHERFRAESEKRRRGAVSAIRFAYLHRDGRRLEAHSVVTPMMHPERGFTGAVASIVDLAAIEAADSAESEQRERFRAIFDAEPHAVLLIDLEMRLVEANHTARAILGGEAAPGREMFGDLLPEYRQQVLTALEQVRRGEPASVRVQVRPPDGVTRWMDCTMGPMRGASGGVERFVVISRDVTAEIEAQRESSERYELLQNILDHIPIMIAEFGPHGRPQFFNRELERVLGWTVEEAARDPEAFLASIHPDPEERREALGLIARADSTWYRLRQHARDGRVVNALCLTRRLADGSVLGIAEDISERVQLEQQLLQSQRLDSVGRLAGGVAHDFNNLLTVILGYGEMLGATLGSAHPGHSMLEEILRSGGRARDLTAQLLAFARRQVIRPRRVQLDEVVRGTERLMRRLIGEHIDLSLDLDAGDHMVRVDPAQIEQVLLNLAINSRDAMPDGGQLTIETAFVELDATYASRHPDVRTGPHVVLVVADTGVGMDPETLSKVFEPFFSTKGPGRGTGLGLATVYGIVRQSGGHIFVYSEPDRGTTFKVYLPEAPALEAEPAAPMAHDPDELAGTERIWVVEDEASVRRLTARILREAGYDVAEAEDPARALELAESAAAAPALLLTDVIMPGMSGRDLATRLQSRWPSMKVLYASGYTHNTIVHHGVLDEGVEFLSKPFHPTQLLTRVRQVLGARVAR